MTNQQERLYLVFAYNADSNPGPDSFEGAMSQQEVIDFMIKTLTEFYQRKTHRGLNTSVDVYTLSATGEPILVADWSEDWDEGWFIYQQPQYAGIFGDPPLFCMECHKVIEHEDDEVGTVCGGGVHSKCLVYHMAHCEDCAKNENLQVIRDYSVDPINPLDVASVLTSALRRLVDRVAENDARFKLWEVEITQLQSAIEMAIKMLETHES